MAHSALQQLTMKGDNLDSYVATFKHLAKRAGYDLTNLGTVHLFAYGLKKGLRSAIMHRDTQPDTFEQWVTAAQNEQKKFARRQAFDKADFVKYQWAAPRRTNGYHQGGQQERRHPNDIPVPMDIDTPVFTRVRRAYTDADKETLKLQGRCYECKQQGHMARDCTNRKKQSYGQSNRGYQYKPRFDQDRKPNPQFNRKPFGSKPMGQFRKKNQFHKPQIRAAYIEDDEEGKNQDEEEYVETLAIRTAKLSDDQRDQWVKEMHNMGINF
jgi:hypothetical protein